MIFYSEPCFTVTCNKLAIKILSKLLVFTFTNGKIRRLKAIIGAIVKVESPCSFTFVRFRVREKHA